MWPQRPFEFTPSVASVRRMPLLPADTAWVATRVATRFGRHPCLRPERWAQMAALRCEVELDGVSEPTGNGSCAGRLPGGVVDRVVQLSNGEYEVHNIGVNWPHHIFVNQEFTVVGAN